MAAGLGEGDIPMGISRNTSSFDTGAIYDIEADREEAAQMRRQWFGLVIGVPAIFTLVILAAFGCAIALGI